MKNKLCVLILSALVCFSLAPLSVFADQEEATTEAVPDVMTVPLVFDITDEDTGDVVTYRGNATAYVDDTLYAYLMENMELSSSSGVHQLTIMEATTQESKNFYWAMDSAIEWIGNSLFYENNTFFLETAVFGGNHNTDIMDWVNAYFNVVDTPSNSDFYQYTEPDIPGIGVGTYVNCVSGSSGTSFSGNFHPAAATTSNYYNVPFWSELRSGNYSGTLAYEFAVWPSNAFIVDPDTGAVTFESGGVAVYNTQDSENTYVFIPRIVVYSQLVYPYTTRVMAQYDTMTYENFEALLYEVNLYDWLTSSNTISSANQPGSGGGGTTDITTVDITPLIERLDAILANQEQELNFFEQILAKLDEIISFLTNRDTIDEETQTELDDQQTTIDETNNDVDEINDYNDQVSTDFNNNFDNSADTFNDFENDISDNANGITWLASTIQEFYEANDGAHPLFVMPLVFGFIALFLGVV